MIKKKKKKRWDETHYVTVFQCAKDGLSQRETAKAMGVSWETFKRWKKTYPAFAEAYRRGRTSIMGAEGSRPSSESFFEYCYNRLSPQLQELWDQMEAWEKEGNGPKKVDALLADRGRRVRQHLFIHAIVATNFNTSEACRKVGVSKRNLDEWAKDQAFVDLLDELSWHKKNFIEGALMKLIAQGSESATIHASKTLNRDRGYDVRTTVEHTGMIGHAHGHVNISDLDTLSVEDRRRLLEAIRSKQAPREATVLAVTDVKEEANDESDS